jgi:histone H3
MARAKHSAKIASDKSHSSSKSKNLKGDTKSVKDLKSKHEGGGGLKKPHRFKPGTVALRQIRKYQKSTDLLIPRAPFLRLLRGIINDHHTDMRLSLGSLEMIRHDAEMFMTSFLEVALRSTLQAKRITLQKKDLQFTEDMMKHSVPMN